MDTTFRELTPEDLPNIAEGFTATTHRGPSSGVVELGSNSGIYFDQATGPGTTTHGVVWNTSDNYTVGGQRNIYRLSTNDVGRVLTLDYNGGVQWIEGSIHGAGRIEDPVLQQGLFNLMRIVK